MHGTLDPTVPIAQSKRFTELLKKVCVDSTLIVFEGAGHGLPTPHTTINPSFEEVMQAIRAFLYRIIG